MIPQHTHWWTESRDDCVACRDELDGPAPTSICEICHSPSIGAWCRWCTHWEYSQPERVWHQDRNRL